MNRQLALKWWRTLTLDEQIRLITKHFPAKMPIEIATSSSKIEEVARKELESE
jgi:hypothetical protein